MTESHLILPRPAGPKKIMTDKLAIWVVKLGRYLTVHRLWTLFETCKFLRARGRTKGPDPGHGKFNKEPLEDKPNLLN